MTESEWLACASPGIGVFHKMFSPFSPFQVTGVGLPSATPEAFEPRNEDQFCACAAEARQTSRQKDKMRFITKSSKNIQTIEWLGVKKIVNYTPRDTRMIVGRFSKPFTDARQPFSQSSSTANARGNKRVRPRQQCLCRWRILSAASPLY